jgi:hypothetical protein
VSADSPEQAANDWFFTAYRDGVSFIHETTSGREDIYFGRVEVEGHGSWVVRTFWKGIYRRGGVRSHKTIADIAKALDWTGDPAELLEAGWDLEEDWDVEQGRTIEGRL